MSLTRTQIKDVISKKYGSNQGETLLYTVSKNGDMEMVKMLLEQGEDINGFVKVKYKVDRKQTPLKIASQNNHLDVAIFLIEQGAKINEAYYNFSEKYGDKRGETPLYASSKHNRVEMVKMLLEHGAEVNGQAYCNYRDQEGIRSLHIASKKGNIKVCRILLDNGAYIHQHRTNGMTAIAYACEGGHIDVVKLLLKHGAKMYDDFLPEAWNRASIHIIPPLYCACKNKHSNIVQLLLDNGAPINKGIWTCRHSWSPSPEGCMALNNLVLNSDGSSQKTPFFVAMEKEDEDTCRVFLNHDKTISQWCNHLGADPIMYASRYGKTAMVKLLLEYGADPNWEQDQCFGPLPPLIIAGRGGHVDVCHVLMFHGATITCKLFEYTNVAPEEISVLDFPTPHACEGYNVKDERDYLKRLVEVRRLFLRYGAVPGKYSYPEVKEGEESVIVKYKKGLKATDKKILEEFKKEYGEFLNLLPLPNLVSHQIYQYVYISGWMKK